MSASASPARAKVLAIVGLGRSGSTLLDMIIGSTPGVVSTGEFRRIYFKLHTRDETGDERGCSCGERLEACPLWGEVLRSRFPAGIDAAAEGDLQREAMRRRNMPFGFLRPWRTAEAGPAQEQVAGTFAKLIHGALAEAGATLFVDSSKVARHALLLAGRADIDLRVVHLIRDPRGSVQSWRRGTTSPVNVRQTRMRRVPAHIVAGMWTASHLTAELLRLKRVPMMTVRYEDLVSSPEATAERILDFAGLQGAPAWTGPATFAPKPQHFISGNPIKSASGTITVRLDDEWRRALPRKQRLITVALTWPLLLWYRYPLWV